MIVNFTLKGITPLLMHADDVEANDELRAAREAMKSGDAMPGGKKGQSVAGDDRSPPWSWQTYLYNDGTHITMPAANIMSTLKWAGTKMLVPGGRGSANFKQLSQSGILIDTPYCTFTEGGNQILLADVLKFRDRPFSEHKKAARKMGFDLNVKRAPIKPGGPKHVRVRAEFSDWAVTGSLEVSDAAITFAVLQDMFDLAGNRSGLGDWRPSSPKASGPYGRFQAVLKQVSR